MRATLPMAGDISRWGTSTAFPSMFSPRIWIYGQNWRFSCVFAMPSHAHRNLVVHRDLKPSNILVTRSGEAKLLDFGIAKILDAALEATQTGGRMLTPEYASPEQVRGAAQNTATDIYSLGAILYKLLTGSSPRAAWADTREAMLAAICTQEPAPPSRVRSVPRDLDFIVSKGLRKEPEERYPSVEALADDVRAFLESRPVRAIRRCVVPDTQIHAAILGSADSGVPRSPQSRGWLVYRESRARYCAAAVRAGSPFSEQGSRSR